MSTHKSRNSISGPPSPDPKPAPKLHPAVLALSFTVVLVQIQAAAAHGADGLLPVLIAALLAVAGAVGALRTGFALQEYQPP